MLSAEDRQEPVHVPFFNAPNLQIPHMPQQVDVRYWKPYLDDHFRKISNITTYQHFRLSSNHPGDVIVRMLPSSAEKKIPLLKLPVNLGEFLTPPNIIKIEKPPGLSAERAWYLFDNSRDLCEESGKEDTCPMPDIPHPKSTKYRIADGTCLLKIGDEVFVNVADKLFIQFPDEYIKEIEVMSQYGPYAYDLYRKALEDGSEKDSSVRVNVVGNFGQGKTSLVRRLVRKGIDDVKSTNGIDILRYKCKLDASGNMIRTDNPDLDLSDIAERIKSVAQKEKEKPISWSKYQNAYPSEKSRGRPKDMSIEERDKLLELLKHPTEQHSSGDSTKAFDIWDFGGQYVFYATHTLFHSRKAIYLLVFNLSLGLTDIVPNDDEEMSCINTGERTMEYYIRFWVNSVHSFVANKDGTEPKIILVGTHLDDLKGDDQEKQRQANRYFDDIRALFRGKQALNHIWPEDFALDNRDVREGTFDALRETILRVGQDYTKSITIPAKWIQLEKSLFRHRRKKILNLEEIVCIDSENEYSLSNIEQIKLFLKHKHDQGMLFFFDEEPISKYVVLDPQFLIDAFKCLITADRFIRNQPKVYESWLKLNTEGRLETLLLDKLWSSSTDGQLFMTHKATILWFLQKHRIISEAMRFDETEQVTVGLGWYIVPSLLTDHSQATEINDFLKEKNQTKIKFVISFDNSSVVQTVYHRLSAAVLGKWPISTFREKRLFFENMSVVRINVDHAGIIEMNDRHILLYVLNLCPSRNVKKMIPDSFRRFAESAIMYEFRKYQRVAGQNDLPYERGYTCNHKSHEVSSCKTVEVLCQLDERSIVPCPDSESHDIDTTIAKAEWFQGNELIQYVSSDRVSDRILSKLSQYIGEDWEILGSALGVSRVKIEHIRKDNHISTCMQIYKMLLQWLDTYPDTASLCTLVKELQNLPKVTVDWDGIRNIVDEQTKCKRPGSVQ